MIPSFQLEMSREAQGLQIIKSYEKFSLRASGAVSGLSRLGSEDTCGRCALVEELLSLLTASGGGGQAEEYQSQRR